MLDWRTWQSPATTFTSMTVADLSPLVTSMAYVPGRSTAPT